MTSAPSIKETISAHDEGEDLPRMGSERDAQHCTVPAGWRLVPIEPTPEMVAAMAVIEASSHQITTYDDGTEVVIELIGMSGAVEAYEAMLAAADPYPKGEVVGPCVCGSWPGGECLRCAQLLSAAPQSDGWILPSDSLPEPDVDVIVWSQHFWEKAPSAKIDQWSMQREAPLEFSSATIEVGFGWNEHDDFESVIAWKAINPPAPTQGQSHGE
ncbi:hypothetical protein D9M72_314870 [compost metagenome]